MTHLSKILIIYYSSNGSTKAMAEEIAKGVVSTQAQFIIRTVPKVCAINEKQISIPDEGAPFVTAQDIEECDGLIIGSPTRFGNMAAPIKYFIDSLGAQWYNGSLIGKPAAVFTSTASMHGGQETTLLTMMLPLLHLGAILVGIPYKHGSLSSTRSGGTPYGASHWSGPDGSEPFTKEEQDLCFELGKRVANVSLRLKGNFV